MKRLANKNYNKQEKKSMLKFENFILRLERFKM